MGIGMGNRSAVIILKKLEPEAILQILDLFVVIYLFPFIYIVI